MLSGVPYRLPDETWGVAVGEVNAASGGSSGDTKLAPNVGDFILVLPRTKPGTWLHEVTEVLHRERNRYGVYVHICRTKRVTKRASVPCA